MRIPLLASGSVSALTDIIAVAQGLLASRGEEAAAAAATRAQAHGRAGEMEGAVFWRQVEAAVCALWNEVLPVARPLLTPLNEQASPDGSPLPASLARTGSAS